MSQVEANVTLFKNSNGNVQIALYSGLLVAFLLDPATGQGRYFTSNKKIERELMHAVDNDNEFGVYIDPAEPVIDMNAATPLEQLEKKIRAKLMAELEAGGKLIDAGVSRVSPEQMQANVASTLTVPGASQSEEGKVLQQSQAPAPILVDSKGQLVQAGAETAPVQTETVQPPEANTPALSALEKLKAGKTS